MNKGWVAAEIIGSIVILRNEDWVEVVDVRCDGFDWLLYKVFRNEVKS